uniref:AlNc14C73G4954 protein n=1 Tax=Albugo laibachii Nc14 TaxID=890382 RepID=F0WE97_9STRA|nr:AlNc14C73G4954 [Albugo laibachii Nc14]|eukprot:CCA19528.1 AlNc14C73G4954 [Albugo laibachii Nc14]
MEEFWRKQQGYKEPAFQMFYLHFSILRLLCKLFPMWPENRKLWTRRTFKHVQEGQATEFRRSHLYQTLLPS